ncbi:DNA repair protein RAD5 [Hondaea fermentalgiana]|uniref:DNA repair protein RAD5 n=1 Tax=Hondaea fermentalgiana TaxID=2315210 RepID=A0A2R5G2C0_9STRA|nr:DNA repair protein RAD5 [Hondaea fermentalgiana]|eukprot:GBG25160.1 DNA repair protein RAD5 [Hondaea fermentalgiana]
MLRTPRQLRAPLLDVEDAEGSLAAEIARPAGLDEIPLLDDTDVDDDDSDHGGGTVDVDPPLDFLRVASHEQNIDNMPRRPAADAASVLVSTYNLTSTILGAGILSIPYALAQCGLVVGLLLLSFTAVASTMSCNLILSSYLRTGRGSFGDLALALFGPWTSNAVKVLIVVLNIGAASAYILVVKSLLPPSLCEFAGSDSVFCKGPVSDDIVTGIVVFGIVYPLCCLENLSSLRHTSMLAFIFAVFLTTAIAIRSVQFGEFCGISYGPKSYSSLFQGLPVFCFSFVCHLNVLPVYGQLRKRSPDRMRNVFRNAIVFAMLLYCVAGSFGYIRFSCTPEGVPDNILAIGFFPTDDYLIAAARIAEAFTCTLALPLIQYPTRVAIHSWLFATPKYLNESNHQPRGANAASTAQVNGGERGNGAVAPTASATTSAAANAGENASGFSRAPESQALLSQQQQQQQQQQRRQHGHGNHNTLFMRAIEAFGILLVGYTLALVVPNVSTVFGLLGSVRNPPRTRSRAVAAEDIEEDDSLLDDGDEEEEENDDDDNDPTLKGFIVFTSDEEEEEDDDEEVVLESGDDIDMSDDEGMNEEKKNKRTKRGKSTTPPRRKLKRARHNKGKRIKESTAKLAAFDALQDEEDRKEAAAREKMREVLSKMEDNRATRLFDLCQIPPTLNASLHPHQHQALSWLYTQELKHQCGMLCDDQGLGKTVEMIALILKNTPDKWKAKREKRIEENKRKFSQGKIADRDLPFPEGCSKTTLCVLPISLIKQWKTEIERFSSGLLRVGVYDTNADRDELSRTFDEYDVILTTYSIMRIEGEKPDEKNRKNEEDASQDRRTPIHNSLDELYSQLSFLVHVHMASSKAEWKKLITKPITEVVDMNAKGNTSVKDSLKKDIEVAWQLLARCISDFVIRRTKHTPNADNTLSLVPLPYRETFIRHIPLGQLERRNYDRLYACSRDAFQRIAGETMDVIMKNMFVWLIRLRQFCNHPLLIAHALGADDLMTTLLRDDEDSGSDGDDDDDENNEDDNFFGQNAAKGDGMTGPGALNAEIKIPQNFSAANSERVEALVTEWSTDANLSGADLVNLRKSAIITVKQEIRKARKLARSQARAAYEKRRMEDNELLTLDDAEDAPTTHLRSPALERFYESLQQQPNETAFQMARRRATFWPSSKLAAIIEDLLALRRQNPSLKALVFSQFTKYLDLIEHAIIRYGFKVVRLDGTMSQAEREVSLERFRDDPSVNIFLISLRAGGLGLNLVAGSDVLIADPWWNESLEAQAIDRVHRIGQLKPVRVIRYVTNHSIEEQMLRMQERKRALSAGAFSEKFQDAKTLTLQDLQNIFEDHTTSAGILETTEDGTHKTSLQMVYESLEKQLEEVEHGVRNAVGECIGPHPNRTPPTLVSQSASAFFAQSCPGAIGTLRRIRDCGNVIDDALSDGLDFIGDNASDNGAGDAAARLRAATAALPCLRSLKNRGTLSTCMLSLANHLDCNESFAQSQVLAKVQGFMLNGTRPASLRYSAINTLRDPSLGNLRSLHLECCQPLTPDLLREAARLSGHSLRELRLINCGHVLDDDTVATVLDICGELRAVEFTCAYKLLRLDRVFAQDGLQEISMRDCHEARISHDGLVRLNWSALSTLEILDLSHCKNLLGQRRDARAEILGVDHEKDTVSYVIENTPRLRVLRCAGADQHTFNQAMLKAISTRLFALIELDVSECVNLFASRSFLTELVETAPDLRTVRMSRCPIPNIQDREQSLLREKFHMETVAAKKISMEHVDEETINRTIMEMSAKTDVPGESGVNVQKERLMDMNDNFLSVPPSAQKRPPPPRSGPVATMSGATQQGDATVASSGQGAEDAEEAKTAQATTEDPLREGARHLLYSLSKLSKLEVLELGLMDVIDDFLVRSVAKSCPNLRVVNFSGCSGISDNGVRALAFLHKLEELDLSWCPAISHATVIGLLQHLPRLRSLRLYGCHDLDVLKISEAIRTRAISCNPVLSVWFG